MSSRRRTLATGKSISRSTTPESETSATARAEYAKRLIQLQDKRWKQTINPHIPYAWNTRRLCRDRVLDVGCGIGRNLNHLRGAGVGVDRNPESVAIARSTGLETYVPEEFMASDLARPGNFDTLLVAHVLEHVDSSDGNSLLKTYSEFLRPSGRAVLICPQERGYASDETHLRWVDVADLRQDIVDLGGTVDSVESFPFPRGAGRYFIYNESVVTGTLP